MQLETSKRSSKCLLEASLATIGKPKIARTMPETLINQNSQRGPPVKVAKGNPKGVPRPLQETLATTLEGFGRVTGIELGNGNAPKPMF